MEVIVIALAFVLDLALGDPPNALHPVAWMGKVIALLEKGCGRLHPAAQLIYGVFITLFTTALFVVPLYFIFLYLGRASLVAAVVLAAMILKSTFSLRGLRRATLKVKELLQKNNLDDTRRELRALVSRETRDLPEPLLASAAIESAAEGLCDSVVAPLFYFILFGLPGAVAYRVVNTLDAMIGYHGKYEHLGKFAARLDDVLNFIPARLAALLLVLAAFVYGRGTKSWRTARQEHRRTESPNAGWPMAAMAGALEVRLEKPGHYVLGEENGDPSPETISGAASLLSIASAAWMLVCLIEGGIEVAVTA